MEENKKRGGRKHERKGERKKEKKKEIEKKKTEKGSKDETKKTLLDPACIPPCPQLNKRTIDNSKHSPPFLPPKKQGNVIPKKEKKDKLRGRWFYSIKCADVLTC